jgi:hypothetical protein
MECHATLARTIGLIVLAVGMTAVSFLVTWMEDPIAIVSGWIGTVFFGLCTGKLVLEAVRGGALITISEEGIDDRRHGFGLIPWDDIQAVWIQSMGVNRFLCVGVADPQRYLARLSGLRRMAARANAGLGFSPITLNFTALRPGLDDAMAFIHELCPSADEDVE